MRISLARGDSAMYILSTTIWAPCRESQGKIVDFAMQEQYPSEIFAERLREARRIRDLDQAELARRARLPASSISHFEKGSRKPSFENLRRLATALSVTTDFLLGRVAEPDAYAGADQLYRDVQNLSARDREIAEGFLKMLAEKQEKEKDEG